MASTIAVFGATGAQGGGVVNALLKHGKFPIRALTRDPASDKSKALSARGVEVVQASLDDSASLVKALGGATYVFLNTDFYKGAGGKAGNEVAQGRAAIDAAKQAGVKLLVYSALEDVRRFPDVPPALKEVSPGHVVAHFETKGEITEYLKTSGVPYTVLMTSIYYQNWVNVFPFIPQKDGGAAFYINAGTKGLAAHDVADIGATAAVALADPEKFAGLTIPVVGEYITMDDVAATISRVTGKTLKYVNIPDEAAWNAGYPGAEDIANMFAYYTYFDHYNELRPIGKTVVKGKTFAEWAEKNKEALAGRFP